MTPNNGLSRDERLRGERNITALFGGGRGGSVRPVRYLWMQLQPTADMTASVTVLFTCPKRLFKRAYKRNLLKRRMREAYRLNKGELMRRTAESGKAVRMAVMYNSKEIMPYADIENAVKTILEKVVRNI